MGVDSTGSFVNKGVEEGIRLTGPSSLYLLLHQVIFSEKEMNSIVIVQLLIGTGEFSFLICHFILDDLCKIIL